MADNRPEVPEKGTWLYQGTDAGDDFTHTLPDWWPQGLSFTAGVIIFFVLAFMALAFAGGWGLLLFLVGLFFAIRLS